MKSAQTRLKQSIIDIINTPEIRQALISEIGLSTGEQAFYVQLKENKPGGALTKIDVLKAISKVTGKDIEDLTEVVVKPKSKSLIVEQK